jgi:glucose-1-phosphate thymidylyltransferase
MKAIVLAGGRGTRLRPLTHTRNKHLIPIGGKPMIERVIDDVVDLGITEIFINVNKDDVEIREALGDGSRWGVQFTYMEQEIPNGMMYPILMAEEMLGGDDFLLHAGDNILSGGLKKYYEEFKNNDSSAHLLVTKVKYPERFGVAVVEDGFVTKTVEKPKEFVSNLAVTGVYFYTKDIIEAMKHVDPIITGNSKIAEYYPPLPHQWLIDNGYKVTVTEVTGWWKDTGKPEDLIAANHLALETLETNIAGTTDDSNIEGRVELGEGSSIENSIVRGPVFIGKNVKITNAYVGPFTAISNDCVIENCEVENSIIMSGARITNLHTRLDASLVGYNATVSTKHEKPRTLNLFIGDNSDVKLP